eukprot:3502153-Alexandrium_andersonii.AAC.1
MLPRIPVGRPVESPGPPGAPSASHGNSGMADGRILPGLLWGGVESARARPPPRVAKSKPSGDDSGAAAQSRPPSNVGHETLVEVGAVAAGSSSWKTALD